MQPTNAIRRLPRLPEQTGADQTAIALATKHQKLRLHALRTAPDAFASSYEVESQWGLDRTLGRLSSGKVVNFVSVRAQSESGQKDPDSVAALLSTEWTGFIALLGPESKDSAKVSAKKDPFAHMTGSGLQNGFSRSGPAIEHAHGAERSDDDALDFHIGAVFVDPSARRGGVGRALIKAALMEAEDQTCRQGAAAFEITIYVDSNNNAAIELYKKAAGFVPLGEETYSQQTLAPETGEVRRVERVALLMEVRREVK